MTGYENCQLCPRRCGVDRTAGELGFCRMSAGLTAARAALHHWEEPVLSANGGSGTVFFSGCTLRCAYCQNYEISTENRGKPLTTARLKAIFLELLAQGAQNLELVTPTQFLPDILPALEEKLPVPVVYNCGGYERVQTLQALEGKVDVWLPDMKYVDRRLARRLSAAEDYPEVARAAILEMYRQTGPYVLQNGALVRGVLIRHLVLPGQLDNTIDVLNWIAEAFPPHSVLVSLMSQYVPMGRVKDQPPFDRRITGEEYDAALSWLSLNGLTDGFTQELEAASAAYLPEFDGEGI